MSRIAFSAEDADHLYELSLEHFQPGCYSCDKIKKRLEKFIGPNNVRQTKRAVKRNPYDNDPKKDQHIMAIARKMGKTKAVTESMKKSI